MRTLALPEAVKRSLTSLREKLVKIGAKVVRHGRYVIFQMAEVAVPKGLVRKILRLIARAETTASPSVHSTVMRATQRRERCVVMTRNRGLETPAVSKSPPSGGRDGCPRPADPPRPHTVDEWRELSHDAIRTLPEIRRHGRGRPVCRRGH